MKSYFKKNWAYWLAFFLPFVLMFTVYLANGIFWGSDRSPLLGDGFHQYVIFDITLRNILHGDGSLFYTFTSGLGLNFYALSSYYLGSFFSPLVAFFDLTNMPDAVYLFTMCKFGLIGLSTFYSLNRIFKKIPSLLTLALSISYSLMSFTTSQLEIKTWLDVFILIPLILLGLHLLVTEKKRVLYFTTLSTLFIQNYYFGYMTAIFLVFWWLCLISWEFKKRWSSLFDVVVISILAGLTSLIMTLPTFLDLTKHGEKLTPITRLQTENSWYLDLFAKQFIGSFDTTKYGSIPMIFVGLIPFLLTLIFFTLKSIPLSTKACHLFLISLLIASFYLEPLDLFWQGMHAPNMFLHRYSWIFSTILIYMAAEVLNRLQEIRLWQFLFSIGFVIVGFSLTVFFQSHYSFLNSLSILLTIEFLIVYSLLLFAFIRRFLTLKLFSTLLFIFALIEIGLNATSQLDGIAKEWGFASRSAYHRDIDSMVPIMDFIHQRTSSFTRTEKLNPQTGNDSMKFNYNGISQFSSVRNRAASATLDKLGFKSAGTNLNLRYHNNSLLADSLFGVHYNISDTFLDKYGFHSIYQKDQLTVYENQFALPIVFASQSVYKDVNFTEHTLDNQTQFLNQIADLDLTYFQQIDYQTNPIHSLIPLNGTNTTSSSEHYSITIPDNSQVYLSLSNLTFGNQQDKNVDIIVNGEKKNFTTDNAFAFFNLGYTEKEKVVDVQLSFPNHAQVNFDRLTFYRLDTKAMTEAIQKINQQKVETTSVGNTLTVNYHVNQDTSLLLTIPYDEGWSATQEGKKLQIEKAQKGFMKINVPKGSGQISLSFIPNGFILGASLSIFSIFIFLLYDWIRKKQLNNHKP